MSDEGTRVDDGELVVLRNGTELLAHGNYSLLNVAAVYEPTDLSDDSSLVKRWIDTTKIFALSIWLKHEIEAGRVRIFDQRYQAAPAAKEEVITIGGKKYTIKEVPE